MGVIIGILILFAFFYVFNEMRIALNNIKIIRQELDSLADDVREYMQYTEPLIEETNLEVWGLDEVKYKRERAKNASILDIPDQDWCDNK